MTTMQEENAMAAFEGEEDESEPMMEKSDSKKSESQPGPDDYVEKEKFCYCMSLKCGVIIIGILLFIDFILEIIDITDLVTNEYFDKIYFQVYAALIVGYAVAVILYIVYFFMKDSP